MSYTDIKVSVIMPFFNRVDWTIESIRSVLSQTHANFELLLIDDGSTEDITDLIDLCTTDNRIVYLCQENAGPAKARNTGILHATGKYIAFLDSDDLFLPNKLKTQIEFMELNDLALSHTSYNKINSDGKLFDIKGTGKLHGNVFPEIINKCKIATPTVMGLTPIFKENKFPEEFSIGEDVCLWILLTSKYVLGGINQGLTSVRIHDSAASTNKTKQHIGLQNIAKFVESHKLNTLINTKDTI